MTDEAGHRAIVEAAYARLREKLEAKDVSVDGLKEAAFEALATARTQVELDPDSVQTELSLAPGTAEAHGLVIK